MPKNGGAPRIGGSGISLSVRQLSPLHCTLVCRSCPSDATRAGSGALFGWHATQPKMIKNAGEGLRMGAENSSFFGGPAAKVARGGPLARTSRHMRTRWAIAIASCLFITRQASADSPADSTEQTGVEEPARYGSEPARAVANAFLWPVRLMVDLVFLTTGTAGALLQNEQIVPRTRDFFFTSN